MTIYSKLNQLCLAVMLSCSPITQNTAEGLDSLPSIDSLLPQNKKEILFLHDNYQKVFNQSIREYITALEARKNPNEGIRAIEKAYSETQVILTKCWLIGENNPELLGKVYEVGMSVIQEFAEVLSSPDLIEATLSFCEERHDLLPHQTYYFKHFLVNFGSHPEFSKRIVKVVADLDTQPQTPYVYLHNKGAAEPASATIFNANVLFMPDNYTYYFGGVSPWSDRIDRIISVIREMDPAIICLQEVHDAESAYRLADELKDSYPHIYLNIGSRLDNLDATKIKMNSGLFVASKYPLEQPNFTPFAVEGMQEGINKGFFSADVLIEGSPKYRLIATHLNPFEDETARNVRSVEVETILSFQSNLPKFVVGDFNIIWGSDEYYKLGLEDRFYDAYNINRMEVTEESETCTEFFNEIIRTPVSERSQLERQTGQVIDYAVWAGNEPEDVSTHTSRVSLYSLDAPKGALSDHHGLITTIQTK